MVQLLWGSTSVRCTAKNDAPLVLPSDLFLNIGAALKGFMRVYEGSFFFLVVKGGGG